MVRRVPHGYRSLQHPVTSIVVNRAAYDEKHFARQCLFRQSNRSVRNKERPDIWYLLKAKDSSKAYLLLIKEVLRVFQPKKLPEEEIYDHSD